MVYALLTDYGMALWQSAWSVSVFLCRYLLLGLLAAAIFRRWSRGHLRGFNNCKRLVSAIGKDFKQLLMFYAFEIVIGIFAAGLTLSLTDTNPYLASLPFLAIILPSLVLKGAPKVEDRIYNPLYSLLLFFIVAITLGAFATSWLLPSLAALIFYGIIFWEL